MARKAIKKGERGPATSYISRKAALNQLQLNLFQFRNLCILKGVYPRQPKAKLGKAHKVYYLTKDIKYIERDPNIAIIRARTTFNKKIKKARGRGEKDKVEKLLLGMPSYKIDHIIKERYPTFLEAVADLDDCLTLMYLFSRHKAIKQYTPMKAQSVTRKLREFEAYCVRSKCIRKTFVSIKGIYYQAEILGQTVTWLTPHQFLKEANKGDVDMLIMTTFLEFYDCLLGFVLYKLYNLEGLHYPPILRETSDDSGVLDQLLTNIENPDAANPNAMQVESKDKSEKSKQVLASEKRIETLNTQKLLKLDQQNKDKMEVEEPQESNPVDEEFQKQQQQVESTLKGKSLFEGMRFWLSREVPKSSLEFLIRAFGGEVYWDAPDFSRVKESDDDITHEIVDREHTAHQFLGRTYIQPQWIYDSINEGFLLPVSEYGPTATLPPHLSPFVVGDNHEGYVPQRRIYLDKLKASLEEGTPFFDEEETKENEDESVPGETEENEGDDTIEEEAEEQDDKEEDSEQVLAKLHAEELKAEMSGKVIDATKRKKMVEKANTLKRKAAEREEEEERLSVSKDQYNLATKKTKRVLAGIRRREIREKQKGEKLESKRKKVEEEEKSTDKKKSKK